MKLLNKGCVRLGLGGEFDRTKASVCKRHNELQKSPENRTRSINIICCIRLLDGYLQGLVSLGIEAAAYSHLSA